MTWAHDADPLGLPPIYEDDDTPAPGCIRLGIVALGLLVLAAIAMSVWA